MIDLTDIDLLARIYINLHPQKFDTFVAEHYGREKAQFLSKHNRLDTVLITHCEYLGFDTDALIAHRTTPEE